MSIAVTKDFFVMGDDKRIYVHGIRDGYNLFGTIDLPPFHQSRLNFYGIIRIRFLNADIVMDTSISTGILFVSRGSGQCFSYCPLGISEYPYLNESIVMSDGQICVGGSDGCCAIFKPPPEVEDWARQYTERMYYHPVLALLPFFSPMLEVTVDAIQLGLSIEELRARFQSSVLETPSVSIYSSTSTKVICDKHDSSERGDSQENISIADEDGDARTIVEDPTSESVGRQNEKITVNRNGGPSRTTREKNMSTMQICRKMEAMELRNNEQELRNDMIEGSHKKKK